MMKKLISKEELYDFLAIFFCVLNGYCRYSSIENRNLKKILATVFAVIGVGMLALKVIDKFRKKQFSEKHIKIALIVAAAAALVWYRPLEMYTAILVSLNYLNKDLRKLIKYIFIASAVSFGVIVLLSLCGILKEVIFYREIDGVYNTRYSLGFSNPNVVLRFFLPVVFSGMLVFKNNKIASCVFILLSLVLYRFTFSRAGTGIVIVYGLITMLPVKFKEKIVKPELIPFMFVGLVVLSSVMALIFKDTYLNDISNHRLEFWAEYLSNVSILGGKKSLSIGSLDNMFVGTLYYGGIYGAIYFCVLYFFSFNKSESKGMHSVALVFYMMFLYGFVENCTSLGESFIIVMVMIQLFDKKKLNELNEDYNEEVKLAD